MDEQATTIPLPDGKGVYGLLREVPGAPLIVLAHGNTGSMHEPIHFIGARRLEAAGFSVFRFNFYSSEPDARKLRDITVTQQAADLDAVLRHFRAAMPEVRIGVAGHSLGGLIALIASEPIDALAFWDATHTDSMPFLDFLRPLPGTDLLAMDGGVECLFGPSFATDLGRYDSTELMQRNAAPALVVAAAAPGRPETAQSYVDAATADVEFHVVPGSDHCFLNGETHVPLHDRTIAWFDRRLRRST